MEVETPTQHRGQQPCKNASTKQPPSAATKPLHNPLLVVNFLLMVVGSACGPLFLRAYFLRGGSRKWLSSLLQTAGWPLLLVPLSFSYSRRRREGGGATAKATLFFLMTPRLLAASVVVGLMTGLDDLLYAYGLAYLPVSTSSILISTQLAFTAAFALLLVPQRFTAFSVNAVVLLSVGAAMLGMNAGGDRPAGVSRAQYCIGFAMTLGAAALYGLVLPVMELSQARHAARAGPAAVTYTLIMEMQLIIGFAATAFSAVGMLVNNDFHAIPGEAQEFGLGQAQERSYRVCRVCTGIPCIIMGYSVDKRLRPTAEFLKSAVGLQGSNLQRVITSFPDILSRDVDKILRPNLVFLRSCGFSKDQVMALVSGYPPVLIKSIKHCLEPRMKFLVEIMGRDMGEVVDYPQFFRHGLKRSLEYRHKVLKQTNSRCSLSEMLDCNQKKFAMKFGLVAAV